MEGELVIPQLFYKLLFFYCFLFFVQPYVSNNAKPSGAKIKTGGGWQRTVPGWHRVNLFPPFLFLVRVQKFIRTRKHHLHIRPQLI